MKLHMLIVSSQVSYRAIVTRCEGNFKCAVPVSVEAKTPTKVNERKWRNYNYIYFIDIFIDSPFDYACFMCVCVKVELVRRSRRLWQNPG